MRKLLLALAICSCSLLRAFDATIPVLHLPDYYDAEKKEAFLEKLDYAMHEVGFFALTGTGIAVEVLDKAYDQAAEFYKLDLDTKMALQTANGARGYSPGESAKDENRIDTKEFYHVGPEMLDEDLSRLHMPKNVWPEEPTDFKPAMQALFASLDQGKIAIGEAISEAIGMDADFIPEMVREGNVLMRSLHYPARPPAEAIWAGAHTDINLYTLLPRATARGLQVLNNEGEWIDVIVPDGAFVINVGDMLENITNGYCRSSVHRVIDPGLGEERFSLVMFVHPRSPDRLDPLAHMIEKTGGKRLYANVTRLELLAERLIDLGLASHELMTFFINSGAIERLRAVGRFSPKAEATLINAGFIIPWTCGVTDDDCFVKRDPAFDNEIDS